MELDSSPFSGEVDDGGGGRATLGTGYDGPGIEVAAVEKGCCALM
jgi:hypothetical protein